MPIKKTNADFSGGLGGAILPYKINNLCSNVEAELWERKVFPEARSRGW
jgi:hypothetical protein